MFKLVNRLSGKVNKNGNGNVQQSDTNRNTRLIGGAPDNTRNRQTKENSERKIAQSIQKSLKIIYTNADVLTNKQDLLESIE